MEDARWQIMRYCAGDKYIRNTVWVKIPVIVTGDDHKTVHKWCRAQPGGTKFYHHYAGRHWWFESEQDAIMFKLRWGKYVR